MPLRHHQVVRSDAGPRPHYAYDAQSHHLSRRWGTKRVLGTTEIGNGSPYSITERRVPELISVLGSQPAGDVSHKPGSRLTLHSARPAVTLTTLKRAATNFAAW